jgi:hypothetical protein
MREIDDVFKKNDLLKSSKTATQILNVRKPLI